MEEKKQLKKTYSNEEITVVWQPHMCTHSKKCWKGLLEVFDPREKPWIQLDGATNEQIKNQIDQCPSKALSYQLNNL
ncbi:(4Fe-4S)-binding protein [Polaribacter gochangensis]|uniref:(4Fe-4S)-binding protein n=1 Tax=Polaribacter gochangensis TaxID=3252903 RepID=UPI0039047C57